MTPRILLTLLYVSFVLLLSYRAWIANQYDDRLTSTFDSLLALYLTALIGAVWLLH